MAARSTTKQSAQQTPEPHELEEDPEQLLGEVIKDPWADPDQLDWPNDEENN